MLEGIDGSRKEVHGPRCSLIWSSGLNLQVLFLLDLD